jgi:type II secretory pathway predicted ATPase ExeA
MYRPFFGLQERPFDLTPNPRFLVLTESHEEALSMLEYGITSRKGITLLLGDAGTGKTTLIRAAAARQTERVHCVHVSNPALTRPEFVEMLANHFGLSHAAQSSKTTLLCELEGLLKQRHDRGEATVLIIDEAQSLAFELLEEIRLLANIETDEVKLLSVVLAGQPELASRLNEDSLRQLKQRIALRCELRPLTQTETFAYVAGRVRAAGGVGGHVFTREAVALLHQRSGGIPRTISVIADNALLTAFALCKKPVTAAVVQEVCRDLDLHSTDDAARQQPSGEPEAPSRPRPQEPERLLAFDAASTDQATPAADAAAAAEDGSAGASARKRRRFAFF